MSTPAAPVTHPFDMLDRETQMGAGPALAQFLQMGPQQAVPWMGRAIGAMRNPSCIPSADTQRVITFLNKWAAPHINVRNVREWRAKKPAVANMEFGISLAGKVCVAAACALGVVSLGLQTSYFHRALVIAARVAAVIFAAMALALRRVNIPLREEASKVCMVATCAIGLFSLGLQKASCLRALVIVTRISAVTLVASGLTCWSASTSFGRIVEALDKLTVENLQHLSEEITNSYKSSIVMRIYLWRHCANPPQEHPGTDLLVAQLDWMPPLEIPDLSKILT